MTKPRHVWVVRAGTNNRFSGMVEEKKAIAIGWKLGDLSDLKTREDFKAAYLETYPSHSKSRVAVNAGQIYRFVRGIKEGDYLLTIVKESREVIIGIVTGGYSYETDVFSEDGYSYSHLRHVNWLKRVSRDSFNTSTRSSMGSSLTVFNMDAYLNEIHKLAEAVEPIQAPETREDEVPPFFEEVKAQADELIADLISNLDPYDFQDLCAAVLRAMGYRAFSSPPGRDRGIDLLAHPDSFGFERPHIKGQVKHRSDKVSGEEMRSFLGALKSGDNGLYFSTGGFTSDAIREAEHNPDVSLLDRDGFINLMLEYYHKMEPEFQAKVPLRRVWIPTE